MTDKIDHRLTPKADLPGELHDEPDDGVLRQFTVDVDIVAPPSISRQELERVLAGALSHSTAADAISDALHASSFDCEVTLEGMSLRSSTPVILPAPCPVCGGILEGNTCCPPDGAKKLQPGMLIFMAPSGEEAAPGWYEVVRFDHEQTREYGPSWWWECRRLADGLMQSVEETSQYLLVDLEGAPSRKDGSCDSKG